ERFKFSNFRPGEQVTLVADQNYPDAQLGHVVPEGWVFKNIAEENLIWEQFKNGDLTFAGPPEDKNAEARELAQQGALQLYEAPATSLRFISFNLADPTNPQNG